MWASTWYNFRTFSSLPIERTLIPINKLLCLWSHLIYSLPLPFSALQSICRPPGCMSTCWKDGIQLCWTGLNRKSCYTNQPGDLWQCISPLCLSSVKWKSLLLALPSVPRSVAKELKLQVKTLEESQGGYKHGNSDRTVFSFSFFGHTMGNLSSLTWGWTCAPCIASAES